MPRADTDHSGSEPRSPRRAPLPDARQRDAERSRQRILDAAVEEFSSKGFAGARVADIASRAGVNAQLIAYYFGGKQGLYDTLRDRWVSTESVFANPNQPFGAMLGAFLDTVCDHPSWARLLVWQALSDGSEPATPLARVTNALDDIRRRQESGELTKEFDPETILVVLWAAVMAPVTIPQVIHEVYGADLDVMALRTRYASQLGKLFTGTLDNVLP